MNHFDRPSVDGHPRAIVDFLSWQKSGSSAADRQKLLGALQDVEHFHKSRVIGISEKKLNPGGPFGAIITSLFLSFRDRSAMIDYLRLQETAFLEADTPDPLIEIEYEIRAFARDLGKSSIATARFGVQLTNNKYIALKIDLDPLKNIRRAYARILKAHRKKEKLSTLDEVYLLTERLLARLKLSLVSFGVKRYLKWCTKRYKQDPDFVPKNVVRLIDATIYPIFENAIELSDFRQQPTEVLSSYIGPWLKDRCESLIEAIPKTIIDNGGFSKFLKVLIGTLIGLSHAQHNKSFNLETAASWLKIAFCWATTYPLVDDILDKSANTNEREDVGRAILSAFSYSKQTPEFSSRSGKELYERMCELCVLCDNLHGLNIREAIIDVFEVHARDAAYRVTESTPKAEDVLAVTLLKSMLVRVATMYVCGIMPSSNDLQEMERVAIFNQLGDDLWDIEEDLETGAITPITFGYSGSVSEGIHLYLEQGAFLISVWGDQVTRPVALAIAHTFRLANDASSEPIRRQLEKAIFDLSPCINSKHLYYATQHIDPDSLIFDLEKSIFAFLKRSRLVKLD